MRVLLGDGNFPDAPERTISHGSLCGEPPDLAGTAHTEQRRIQAFASFKCIAFERQLAIFSQNTLRRPSTLSHSPHLLPL